MFSGCYFDDCLGCSSYSYPGDITSSRPVAPISYSESSPPHVVAKQTTPSAPSQISYKVKIPNGVQQNQYFMFTVQGQLFQARCPYGYFPGQELRVLLPPNTNISAPIAREHIDDHINSHIKCVEVFYDHIVDEKDQKYSSHQILSARKGDTLELLSGNLDEGLPDPYDGYVRVKNSSGKVGLVSRYVLRYIISSKVALPPPPPAIRPTMLAPPPAIG